MSKIERAIAFLERQNRPVELAWARHTAGQGSTDEVIAALETHQNPDGGFGKQLEVDIHAPDSQAFAARLAMLTMIDCGIASDAPIVTRLAGWLEREQGEDGDWRFSPGIYQHQLAPWFAGWQFPALNPALCVAGAARRIGIGSDRLFARVERLFAEQADIDAAEGGAFYDVLPYAEYIPWSAHPERERYLDAIARGIGVRVSSGGYDDASHVFTHVGHPDNPIAQRLPTDLIESQLDRLASEQREDGGWPSPYDQGWRPMITADALAVLRAYGRLSGG